MALSRLVLVRTKQVGFSRRSEAVGSARRGAKDAVGIEQVEVLFPPPPPQNTHQNQGPSPPLLPSFPDPKFPLTTHYAGRPTGLHHYAADIFGRILISLILRRFTVSCVAGVRCDIFGRTLISLIMRRFAVSCVAGVPSLRPFAYLTSFRDSPLHSRPSSQSARRVIGARSVPARWIRPCLVRVSLPRRGCLPPQSAQWVVCARAMPVGRVGSADPSRPAASWVSIIR